MIDRIMADAGFRSDQIKKIEVEVIDYIHDSVKYQSQ